MGVGYAGDEKGASERRRETDSLVSLPLVGPGWRATIPFNMHASGLSELLVGGRSRSDVGACLKVGEVGVAWGLEDA